MKSVDTKKRFPNTKAKWDEAVAEAPGSENTGSPEEETEFEDTAIVVCSGGFEAVRRGLAEKRSRGQRGPQKTPTKERITIRLSSDVVRSFRASGTGWQSRIDQALKEWLKNHSVSS